MLHERYIQRSDQSECHFARFGMPVRGLPKSFTSKWLNSHFGAFSRFASNLDNSMMTMTMTYAWMSTDEGRPARNTVNRHERAPGSKKKHQPAQVRCGAQTRCWKAQRRTRKQERALGTSTSKHGGWYG